jgi:hypothetical protein
LVKAMLAPGVLLVKAMLTPGVLLVKAMWSPDVLFIDQGYKKIRLIRFLKKFIFRYQDLVEIYSVCRDGDKRCIFI